MTGELSPEDKQQLLIQFGARAVHDIAGPIDQVSSLIALFIRRYQNKVDEDGSALLSHIEAARLRLANTGSALRNFFRVVTAERTHAPVDLNVIAQAVLSGLSVQLHDAEVVVTDLPVVDGDEELLTLLFRELVSNSLKFRNRDTPLCVEIASEKIAGRHVIHVSDNGIGIDMANAETVFEPFKRLNGHQYPGSGLGLTIVRTIARLHGGDARIEPRKGGTTVTVEFPG